MAAQRTQIYLSAEQRHRLDALRERTGMSLAEAIRTALDRYLDDEAPQDLHAALERTFGAIPGLSVPPRGEWDRGNG